MKGHLLLIVVGMFFTCLASGAEQTNWSTQSTEHQFGKQIKPTQILSSELDDANDRLKSANTNASTSTVSNLKALMSRPSLKGINQEFWVFDAWLTLHQDRDDDGYYHHFSLELDADTEYASAQVYARLYLGTNEVFQEFHVTDNFTIYGDNSDDSYVIETELLTGFPSDDYEVLIELYDAYSDELVAVYDGYNNDADLYLISLESKNYDQPQVVIVHEHGGSIGLWGLILLPLLLLARIKTSHRH